MLLLVLVDRDWEGKVCNLQINGRHSKNAFFKSKTGTKIRVLLVPKKKHIIFDDEEVAAVTSYIRNSWSNRAGLVSSEQVALQR